MDPYPVIWAANAHMLQRMSRTWPDLSVLAVLVGVDDLGSLGAAARREGMAQPNASRAVRRLEGELGVPLLRRGARGSALTPQGTVVVHWAREVLTDAGRLLDAAETLRGGSSGRAGGRREHDRGRAPGPGVAR